MTRRRGPSRPPPKPARSRSRPGPAASGSVGSGFVIADGYVVTNAHVVAGADADAIRVTGRRRPDLRCHAGPVRSSLDIALLRAPRLDLPALRFASAEPPRGAIAAALGYPGRRRADDRAGRRLGPIYRDRPRHLRRGPRPSRDPRAARRDRTRRQRRPAHPENGTVGGVVFAESRTNEDVGYALSPVAVAARVIAGRRAGRTRGRYRGLPALSRRAIHLTAPAHRTGSAPMPDAPHPYTTPSDPAKRHSAALTDGPDRAAARGMLKAIGFTDEDLAKPLIGVGTTWIETMPCNYNHRRLAEHVKAGIRAAGGTPMEFNTISVSDGVSMGTEGMKAQPHQPRGRRRLDRARRPRPPARRRRLRHRLRQDRPGRGDGPRSPRRPRADPVQRHDLSRHAQGPAERDGRDDLRSDRGLPGRQDHPRRAVRGREPVVPGPRRVRRPVHGQHDVAARSSSWACRPPASTASRPRTRPRTRPHGVPASW